MVGGAIRYFEIFISEVHLTQPVALPIGLIKEILKKQLKLCCSLPSLFENSRPCCDRPEQQLLLSCPRVQLCHLFQLTFGGGNSVHVCLCVVIRVLDIGT